MVVEDCRCYARSYRRQAAWRLERLLHGVNKSELGTLNPKPQTFKPCIPKPLNPETPKP